MAILDFTVAQQKVFAQDIDNLEIIGLTSGQSAALKMTISDDRDVLDIVDISYTADSMGKIYLSDMAKFFNNYIKLFDFQTAIGSLFLGVNVDFELTVGANISHCSREIFYSTRTLNRMPATFNMFATLVRNKKTAAHRIETVYVPSFLTGGVVCKASLAYKVNGLATYKTAVLNLENNIEDDYMYADISMSAIISLIATAAGITDVSTITPLFYDIDLYVNNVKTDTLHYEYDNINYIQSTSLMYLNSLGLPQSLTLSGKDTEKLALEADFGYCGPKYRSIDKTVTPSHEINSGWLTKQYKSAVREIIESPFVAIYDYNADGTYTIREITITEVEWSTERPSTEPDNVTLTYRISDQNDDKILLNTYADIDSIFAHPPFDHTFN